MANVTDFARSDLLPLGPAETEYRLLTTEGVETFEAGGQRFLRVEPLFMAGGPSGAGQSSSVAGPSAGKVAAVMTGSLRQVRRRGSRDIG